MLKKALFVCLFSFGSFAYFAQNISGKVYSKNTLEPIEKAAIATNLNNGTATDVFGNFNLNLKNSNSVTFSCLGYETETLSISALKKINFTVYLTETIHQLAEIKLQIEKISLDTLLLKTARNMRNNFISGAIKNKFYARENTKINFTKLELDLEKSSLLSRKNRKLAQKELKAYAYKLKNSTPEFSSEFAGNISSKKERSKKTKKEYAIHNLDSLKGIIFMTNAGNITLQKAQTNVQNIILKYLDINKTYKISSGFFKIEDSLSIKKIIKKTDAIRYDLTFDIYKPKYYYNDALKCARFFQNKKQYNFFDTTYYRHVLEKPEFIDNVRVYTISFTPRKSKSKFSGKILINSEDYSIVKVVYQFADGKKGQSLNLKWLLGIKVSEDIKTVLMYYEKNKKNKLFLSYFKETSGTYAYAHRPIKFKENSSKKHKVKFDIKIEVDTKSSTELLITAAYNIDESLIMLTKKEDLNKRQRYISTKEYASTNWKNRQLILNYLKKYE